MSFLRAVLGHPLRLLFMLLIIGSSIPALAPATSLAQEESTPAPDEDAAGAPTDLTVPEVVDAVLPGVVQIMAYTEGENAYGIGSGYVLDEEGHIITNWHVVTGQESFVVTYTNGTFVEAELIGTDPRDDIAVLKVDPDTVPLVLPMGDSDAVVPGETVIAIGSPSGITNTVTVGVTSGSGRTGATPGLYLQSLCGNYNNLIQHSADINGGNSGGPLFNLRGEVIGINTISIIDAQSEQDLAGIYYSVPSNTIAKRAADIIEDGEVSIPVFGVQTLPLTVAEIVLSGLPITGGVLITEVANDSPADRAGLEPDMIILAIDDRDLTKDDTLSEILFAYDPGDTITVTYVTLDDPTEEETTELTLAEFPQSDLQDCDEESEEPAEE